MTGLLVFFIAHSPGDHLNRFGVNKQKGAGDDRYWNIGHTRERWMSGNARASFKKCRSYHCFGWSDTFRQRKTGSRCFQNH